MRRIRLVVIALAVGLTSVWLARRATRPEIDAPAVLAQVQRLNQLATVKYTVQKVVGLREARQLAGMESILLVMQAHVEAGIDLGSIAARDVFIGEGGALVVRLPAPKILNVTVDEKATKVWDREKTWWTPWVPYSLDLEQKARVEGLESVKKAALEMGILSQAERNAESSIRALLELAGIKRVVVLRAGAS